MRLRGGDYARIVGAKVARTAHAGKFDARTMASLVDEVVQVRDATMSLVRTIDAEAGARLGTASGKSVSARALIWIIAGHMAHHVGVLRERYGVGA